MIFANNYLARKLYFRRLVMFYKARLPMLLCTVKMRYMNVVRILHYRATWHWSICALHLDNAVNNFVVKIIWSFFCQQQLRLLFQFKHVIGVPDRNLWVHLAAHLQTQFVLKIISFLHLLFKRFIDYQSMRYIV